MKRDEAYREALKGKKIAHRYFSDYEYLEFKDGELLTEDGYNFERSFYEFPHFEDGWEIWEPKPPKNKDIDYKGWWGLKNKEDQMWIMMKYGFNTPFDPSRITLHQLEEIYNLENEKN